MKLFPDSDAPPSTCLIHGEIPAGQICSCTYAARLEKTLAAAKPYQKRNKPPKRRRRHVDE